MQLDEKDKKILKILEENARLTTAQIAQKADIPITTAHNRIKSMRKSGVIRKFTIVPDYKKLDRGLNAYILAKVSYRVKGELVVDQEELAKHIIAFPEVCNVAILTGPDDLLIQVRVKDVEALNQFVIKKLRDLAGIDGTQTMVVMQEI